MEYSLEYGFLRLSQSTRQRLSIPVMVVTLGEWGSQPALVRGWVRALQRYLCAVSSFVLWKLFITVDGAHFPRRRASFWRLY